MRTTVDAQPLGLFMAGIDRLLEFHLVWGTPVRAGWAVTAGDTALIFAAGDVVELCQN